MAHGIIHQPLLPQQYLAVIHWRHDDPSRNQRYPHSQLSVVRDILTRQPVTADDYNILMQAPFDTQVDCHV